MKNAAYARRHRWAVLVSKEENNIFGSLVQKLKSEHVVARTLDV
jgi:hypothetical protein